MKSLYKDLFNEITLPNGVVLNDRLGVAPMTTYSGNEDGTVSDEELSYYNRRAGLGSLYVTACIAVSENGIAFPNQFIGFDDSALPRLKQLAKEMKSKGSKAILQMQHGGRQSKPELIKANETVAPSAVPGEAGKPTPRELTEAEIYAIIEDFGETTKRAIEAGFDGVEIHGANTYLLQQFVSSVTNQRQDQWGGTLVNRMRFPLAVMKKVQDIVAKYADEQFIVGYRLSPEENNEKTTGYTIEETKILVEELIDRGIHYIHVSLFEFKKTPKGAEQGDSIIRILADQIKGRVPFVAVGSVKTPEDALLAMAEGADIVVMGRQALIDPEWTEKIKQGKEQEINPVIKQNMVGTLDIPQNMWHLITSYGMVTVSDN
ncbi:NADH-dependent flavin oxidoreductase [Planococcus halocryophilus Or1]|uniref:NADH:flavin oxidoreductase n=1 Tax=Planococcus halocryophilus TaxID=1215089 RepID=A0A1C7DV61_9BACL|nr:NADH-dependent flavin oxidoreductase [Planococcus halocryophilus]ANU15161.1 NADH:flavin oxidoreductase [Planococcus halocryophilus]EMF47038.1 NADH-dependent flavin oxidoreductase [Planococcus halocryophilus Or1]